MNVPILYWGWQYECCGDPFRVGDEVEWPLSLNVAGEPWMPTAWSLETEIRATDVDGHSVRVGDAVAYAEDPLTEPRTAPVMLYEEHHGGIPENFPATRGTVARIRVVSVVFRGGHAVLDTAELREVDAMPELFRSGSGQEFRSEVGVLVDLTPVLLRGRTGALALAERQRDRSAAASRLPFVRGGACQRY